jgi:predicted aspartyl protease
VEGNHELSMLVDTGAGCTVIDTQVAKRLHLTFLPQTVEYAAFGRLEKAPLAVVNDLKVGPIATSLACVVGDIPTRGVDMILGLNVFYPALIDCLTPLFCEVRDNQLSVSPCVLQNRIPIQAQRE